MKSSIYNLLACFQIVCLSTFLTADVFAFNGNPESATVSECSGSRSVTWDLDSCESPDGNDYSEFTPHVESNTGCENISASRVTRQQGFHSCNPGVNGGVAMCTDYPSNLNSFVDDSPYAIRTSITVDPNNGQDGCFTGFRFYEKADDQVTFLSGRTVDVDFPRRYGIRITCLLYTSPSPRDRTRSRMPSSA